MDFHRTNDMCERPELLKRHLLKSSRRFTKEMKALKEGIAKRREDRTRKMINRRERAADGAAVCD